MFKPASEYTDYHACRRAEHDAFIEYMAEEYRERGCDSSKAAFLRQRWNDLVARSAELRRLS